MNIKELEGEIWWLHEELDDLMTRVYEVQQELKQRTTQYMKVIRGEGDD